MPIDISSEPPIPLAVAAAHIPRRRRGRKTAVSTLHRWATRGLRGVVLETLQVGGTKCTSVAALQRFFDRLSALVHAPSRESASVTDRQRAAEAGRELDVGWARAGR